MIASMLKKYATAQRPLTEKQRSRPSAPLPSLGLTTADKVARHDRHCTFDRGQLSAPSRSEKASAMIAVNQRTDLSKERSHWIL